MLPCISFVANGKNKILIKMERSSAEKIRPGKPGERKLSSTYQPTIKPPKASTNGK